MIISVRVLHSDACHYIVKKLATFIWTWTLHYCKENCCLQRRDDRYLSPT